MSAKLSEPLLEPLLRAVRFHKILRYITANSSVVDIGCGHTPRLLNRLSSTIKDGVGIDPLIKTRRIGHLRLISQTLKDKIDLPTNSADFVTLVAVLEHLEDPLGVLRESRRVLKPGGILLLTTPSHMSKPMLEFLSFGIGLVSQREIAEHKRYYWRAELVAMVKKAGFTSIRHEYFELFLNNFVFAKKET